MTYEQPCNTVLPHFDNQCSSSPAAQGGNLVLHPVCLLQGTDVTGVTFLVYSLPALLHRRSLKWKPVFE